MERIQAQVTGELPTLGKFVRLRWRMEALCYDCTGSDKFKIDIPAAGERYGNSFAPHEFMLGLACKCGRKLSLYCDSPQDRYA